MQVDDPLSFGSKVGQVGAPAHSLHFLPGVQGGKHITAEHREEGGQTKATSPLEERASVDRILKLKYRIYKVHLLFLRERLIQVQDGAGCNRVCREFDRI